MGNMGHCRFQNTLSDLDDCYERLDDDLSPREERAREELIELCKRIADEYGEQE